MEIYKILHINFKDGEIFLNEDKGGLYKYSTIFSKNENVSGLDEEIISKHVIKNVLLTTIGETPLPYKRSNNLSKYLEHFKNENNEYKIFDDTINYLVDKSLYRLDETSYKYGDKYIINLRNGINPNIFEPNNESIVGKFRSVNGILSWQTLDMLDTPDNQSKIKRVKTKEMYNELFTILEKISGVKKYETSVQDFIIKSSENITENDKNTINLYIEKYNKNNRDNQCRLGNYTQRLLESIRDGVFIKPYILKDDETKIPKVDIRFSMLSKPLYVSKRIKYSINVNGDIIVPLTKEIYNQFINCYSPSRIFDGGNVIIEDIIDIEYFSYNEHINYLGYKKVEDLINEKFKEYEN